MQRHGDPHPAPRGILTTAWAPCSRASVCLAPCLRPAQRSGWRGSHSQQFPPLGHSKIDSRKKKKRLGVFPSTLQARKSHPARPLPTQTSLLCAAIREVFMTLKSLPVWHRGGWPGQAGEGELSGRKTRNLLAHVSALCPQGAAGEETRAWCELCSSFDREREQSHGAGHDGANQPQAKSPGSPGPGQAQPLTLTPQQIGAPQATRCPHTSEPGQVSMSQSLSSTQRAGWDGQAPSEGAGRWLGRN